MSKETRGEEVDARAIIAKWKLNKGRIGDLAVSMGFANREAVEDVLRTSRLGQSGRMKSGRALVEAGILTDDELARVVAESLGVFRYVDMSGIREGFPEAIPENLAKSAVAICIGTAEDGRKRVAMADPGDISALSRLREHLGECVIEVGAESAIQSLLERAYDNSSEEMGGLALSLSKELMEMGGGGRAEDSIDDDSAVARFVSNVFEGAISKDGSDVHIESQPDGLDIRIRVNGDLRLLTSSPDRNLGGAVIQRLKLISGLDITERRKPQSGSLRIPLKGRPRDGRIEVSPSTHGENAVVRILSATGIKPLDELGMHPDDLALFRQALARPNGMILLTGPTGSGKTTTLYAGLSKLNTKERKLITVEDPVEIGIRGICQQQVDEKAGFTFDVALRSMLRQDPDVILVGEMRDAETVSAGLRASLTGHLVLSTLHTNDARSVPARMVDMGAEPGLLASALRLVIAQRLVKLACHHCAAPAMPDAAERIWIETATGSVPEAGTPMAGTGKDPATGGRCPRCDGTGWAGRAAVHECLAMDEELVDILAHGTRREFDAEARKRLAGRTLADRAVRLAYMGLTTVAEAQSAAGGL